MEIISINRENVLIIRIKGNIDLYNTVNVDKALDEALEKRPSVLALDLSDVKFIDSTGIGALINALRAIKNFYGEMILFGLQDDLVNTFQQAALGDFFNILTAEEFESKYGAG